MTRICIIGGGNLGIVMAQGLAKAAWIEPENIIVTRRQVHKIKYLEHLNIRISADNRQAIKGTDIIMLAVKPYQVEGIAREISPVLERSKSILISVVTGLSLLELKIFFGKLAIFRAMPNTAVGQLESVTCISSLSTSKQQQGLVCRLFEAVGKSILIDDNLMDAATVLGACGIAFAMRFIRAATQGGIQIGFDAKTAEAITTQVVKGAATLLSQSTTHPEAEIDKVTTPKGCTIAGLNEMEFQGFSASLIKGLIKSHSAINKIPK